MKKMILLLVLPLTVLMAIDFTMTQEGLFTEPTSQSPTPDTVPGETSSYLEPVNLPECNANNTEVQFISSNADWSKINDSSKRIFCVKPGDYSALGHVDLRASGTENEPRYIVLDNGNDTHPGKLEDNELVKVRLYFYNADYWVVDRMSVTDTTGVGDGDRPMHFLDGSSNNIINRLFARDYSIGIAITDNCNDNTIQNSRIQDMTREGVRSDKVAIELKFRATYTDNINIYNTKIINNEIMNQNDGIMLMRHYTYSGGPYQEANFKGTIIDSNRIWNEQSYANDCTGQCPENSIDLKVGSDDSLNPVVVSNNYFWGASSTFPIHYGVKNIVVDGNVFLEFQRAMGAGDPQNFDYSLSDSVIKNNIFYQAGSFNPEGLSDTPYGIFIYDTNNVDINNNIFVGQSDASLIKPLAPNTNFTFDNNVMISSSMSYYSPPTSSVYAPNYYYDTPQRNFTDSRNSVYSNATDANLNDLIFDYDIYSNNPKQKTLIGVSSN